MSENIIQHLANLEHELQLQEWRLSRMKHQEITFFWAYKEITIIRDLVIAEYNEKYSEWPGQKLETGQ